MKFESLLKEAVTVVGQVLEQQDGNCCDGAGDNSTSGTVQRSEVVNLNDGTDIPLSTCDGNKKSLFIGINYFGSKAELRGCINDVKNIKQFVVQNWNFPTDSNHMRVLTDDNANDGVPTRANILAAFKWLVQGAQRGDSLFVHYSGHGGSQQDTDPNTDEVDGMDETLIPVDYEKAGVIVDDDIHAMLVAGLPQGVRLTAIMDCCHSGSVFDLPYTYTPDGNLEIHEVDNRKAAMDAALAAGMSLIKGDKVGALMGGVKAISLYVQKDAKPNEEAKQRQIKIRSTVADVIQFSGCRDEQTSADANIGGQATGAMSWSFIKALEDNGHDQTYVELLGNIRKLLHGKYTQIPQMSTGHRMNMKSTFKM